MLEQIEIPFFYNTNGTAGTDLADEVARARTQEEIIYRIYQQAARPLTVTDVLFELQAKKHNFIKVSVGRAITNLFNKAKLVKLEATKKSIYNKPEHFYSLKPTKQTN